VADPDATKATLLTPVDWNPILDNGCPKSAGGLENVISLSMALGIPVHLSALDCAPFYHGYGEACSDARLTIGIWNLPLVDLNGVEFRIPFYVFLGSGPLLLGNSVLRNSRIDGPKHLLIITEKAGLSTTPLILQTYTTDTLRTRLHVIPCRTDHMCTFFQSVSSFTASTYSHRSKPSNARDCRQFAFRLHGATHLSLADMRTLCKRSGVWTPGLDQALSNAVSICQSCQLTGRPHPSRKVSTTNLSRTFNTHVQVDFFYIEDLDPSPILHIRDTASGLSACCVQGSRDMDLAGCNFQKHWVYIHGPPSECSGDPEFDNSTFRQYLSHHNVIYKARPARRHNKTGFVESGHSSIKLLARRLAIDIRQGETQISRSVTFSEILAHAVFLRNVLYGSRTLSSFEQARGYQPSLAGLPVGFVTPDLQKAHLEQVARRTLSLLLRSKNSHLLDRSVLLPGTAIYFYTKLGKKTSWAPGFVSQALPEYVGVRRQPGNRGSILKIAYEDIRLAPRSSLLQELDALEQICDAGEDSDAEDTIPNGTLLASTNSAPLDTADESAKDVGPVASSAGHILEPTTLDRDATEQTLLHQIQAAIGDSDVSITQLQWVPSWILDKAVTTEKENYLMACHPVKLHELPPRSNVISSHHFFSIKKTSDGNLKLKCRMVPHGNRDREKAGLRTDSATAQFAAIRLLLSLAVLLQLRLSSIDISGAYLQADPLTRDIFVRPPTGWTPPNVVWKLLRPAYGLVESGRLWQLAIERWLSDYGFEAVPGLSQFFIIRDNSGRITMLLAKVVDDLLLAGSVTTMTEFYKALCARFKVGRFICDRPFTFNALNVTQDLSSSSITMDMLDYRAKCIPIDLSPTRRKQSDLSATPEERTAYQSLAGTLNFFGHGVLPPACFVASYLQQQLGDLRVHHLAHANSLLKELLQLEPKLYFPSAPPESQDPHLIAWSDAAHGMTYGQSGFLAGLQISGSTMDSSILHILDWSSSKQRRVSFSSIGSEILAAASAADRGFALTASIRALFPHAPTPIYFELRVDAKGLYDTITTLHESKDYRLRPTVARLRDSFGAEEIRVLRWIPGPENLADCLTKGNFVVFRMLNQVMLAGHPQHLSTSSLVDSRNWQ
jgi:hypothetical protein